MLTGDVFLPEFGGRPLGAARTGGGSRAPSPESWKSVSLRRFTLRPPEFAFQIPPEFTFQLICPVLPQDQQFAVVVGDAFTVHYGPKKISAEHNQTSYARYYIGGLPALLRHR